MLAAAATLTVPSAAVPQVNRCVTADGRVSYSDGACAAGAGVRDDGASRRLSGVVVSHYDVRGTDGASLLNDLAARGPAGFHGITHWNFNYRYHYAPSGSGCRMTSVTTEVAGRILMPRWLDEVRAPAALRATWKRYVAALMAHEEGHMATGQALVRALQADLGALTAPSCGQLKADAERTAAALLDTYRARDRAYDAQTRHGATQGAFLQVD